MKYKDPITGEFKDITIKAGDTLPVGAILEFDGDVIPAGYEEVTDEVDQKEVFVGPNEPTTGEEVWFQKGKNSFNILSVTPYNYGSGLPNTVTDKIVINSFNKNNINFTVNANAYIYALTNMIKLKPNTTYTLSYDRTNTNYSGSNSRCYILNYDNGTYSMNGSLLVDNGTSANRTFTTNSAGTIAIAWGFSNDGNGATVNVSNIQIEQGEVATSYEPYIGKKIHTKNDNGVYEEFANSKWGNLIEDTNIENTSDTRLGVVTNEGKMQHRTIENIISSFGLLKRTVPKDYANDLLQMPINSVTDFYDTTKNTPDMQVFAGWGVALMLGGESYKILIVFGNYEYAEHNIAIKTHAGGASDAWTEWRYL